MSKCTLKCDLLPLNQFLKEEAFMKKLSSLLFFSFYSLGALAEEGISAELLMEQAGKFHPLLLHFPLTIISILPLTYALTYFRFGKIWLPTIPYFIHFASLTMIPTCIAGLMLAGFGEVSETIAIHRLYTLLSAGAIILASIYLLVTRNDIGEKVSVPLWALTLISFVLLVYGAHMGAESVHGDFIILFE